MSDTVDLEMIRKMLADARLGRVDRRTFMRYALAAGASLATAGGMWTTQVAQASPNKGGTFRFGCHDGNTTDTHDPGTYVSYGMINLAHTHRSYLTMITPGNDLGPDIAASWEASADAKRWTFRLVNGATFHNGKTVTPEDVIASMNHHRGAKSTSAAKSLLNDVEDIAQDGSDGVTFKLSSGNADLPWLLTDYHLVICPANADGSIDWQSGQGSGPYKLERFEPGVGAFLTRHDGWHGEGAYFDALEYTFLNDPNARQTALVTGAVDLISQIELRTLPLLRRSPDIEIDNVPSAAAVTMPMFCDTPPFDNVDVRNALKYAIDREEIVEKIAFGTAIPGNDFHVSPSMPYWPDGIPQRTYDPDRAKSLLKKAGAEGLSISLSVADSVYSGAVDLCVLYAEQAKKAGIDINVIREPNDGYYANVWLKKPFCLVQWGPRPTPDVIFSLVYKDDAAWNESHWRHPRFNELLLAAKAELDQERRAAMYREMCLLARDDGGTIIPIFANFVSARRSNVVHSGQLGANWPCDGARAASRWWFGS